MESQKSLVLELRDLARDPDHQNALMANKRCLRSLEQTLQASNDEVVLITIEIFYVCAQVPSNRSILGNVPNLTSTLYDLSTEHKNPKIRQKSNELLKEIDPQDHENYLESCLDGTDSRVSESSRFVPTQLYIIKLRVMDVHGPENRDKFQYDIVKMRGVVSASMSSDLKRVTIYTMREYDDENVINNLRKKGYKVQRFEHKTRFHNHLSIDEVSEKEEFEFDDEKVPQERYSIGYLQPVVERGRSLTNSSLGQYRPSAETETLSSRLARFKQEQEESKEKEKSIFSKVITWFW